VRYLAGYSEPDAPGSDLMIHHAGLLEMQSGLQISKSAARRDFNKATVHLEAQHDRSLVNARHELVVAKGVWEQGLAGQNLAHTTVTKPSLDPAGDGAAAAATASRVSGLLSGGIANAAAFGARGDNTITADESNGPSGPSNHNANEGDPNANSNENIPLPVDENPTPVEPPAPWTPPSLSELDPELARTQLNVPMVPIVPDGLIFPKPEAPVLPPLKVLPDDPGYEEPFDMEAFLENARRQQELRRLGQQLDQLIGNINEAEKDRRSWQYTHVAGTFGLWSLAYGPMELPEKVQRAELELLLVRIIEAELAAGITLEELMNQPSISATPEQSWWKEWVNTAGHSGSLDMLGKPVGRAATELAEGLWSLITDFPGFVDGLNETLKDVSEDPVGFYERVSEAIHRRAQLLTPSGADVSVGYQQILIEIAAGELLSLGAGKLTKAGLTKVLAKLRKQSEILTTVRLLKAEKVLSDKIIGRALPAEIDEYIAKVSEIFKGYGRELKVVWESELAEKKNSSLFDPDNDTLHWKFKKGRGMRRGLMIEELQHALDSLFGKYGKLSPNDFAENNLIHAITANEIIESALFWRLTPAEIEALRKVAQELIDLYLDSTWKNR
jgi:hypothetical protein